MELTEEEISILYDLVLHETDKYYTEAVECPDWSELHGPSEEIKEKLKTKPRDCRKYEVLARLHDKLKEDCETRKG